MTGAGGPRESAAQFRGMVAGLNAVVWERDAHTLAIRWVSERIEEVLGHPVGAWTADPDLWRRSLHPDDRDAALARVRAAVGSGEEDFTLTYRARTAAGQQVWLHHLGHVDRDDAGAPVALRAVLIDVTAEQRRERAAVLLAAAGQVLTGAGGVPERLGAVAELLVAEVAERAHVWLRGADGCFRAVAAAPAATAHRVQELDPVRLADGGEELLRPGPPLVVADVAAVLDGGSSRTAGPGPAGGVLVAPLLAEGRVVGLLTLSGPRNGPGWDDADRALAGDLGARTAAMVAAERLADRQRRSHAIALALSAAGTVAEASTLLADGLRTALGAEQVTVWTTRRDGHLRVEDGTAARGGDRDPRSLAVAGAAPAAAAVRSGEPVWLADRAAWTAQFPAAAAGIGDRVGATVVLPLPVGSRVLGAVGIRFPGARDVDADERAFLLSLAAQAAVAVERAALSDTRQEIADTLQHSLLPAALPPLDRLAVAARYLPGQRGASAGGDWYDVLPLPGGAVAVVVGDVVGNGAAAAAVMGQLRSALAVLLLEGHGPARALALLDRFADRVGGARVSTVACLLLDPVTGRLLWCRAGHPPPLVVGPGGTRWLDGGLGPALGLLAEGHERPEAGTDLEPGSALVLYTDGLVERRGAALDDGLDRLAAAAGELRGAAPGPLADGVLAELVEPSGPRDDIAVVVARLVPAPLELDLPAAPSRLRELRRSVVGWAEGTALPEELTDDLLLAVGEAAANAVEHAYPPEAPGRFAVRVASGPEGLAVRVRDGGRWRPVPGDPGARGRGLAMIGELAGAVEVATAPGGGTEVAFTLPIPVAAVVLPPGHRPGRHRADRPAALVVADGDRLVLEGDLDLAGVRAVRDGLLAAAGAPGGGRLVLDLRGVGHLASVGLALVIEAVDRARAAPGRRPASVEVLLPESGPARRALDLTGVPSALPVRGGTAGDGPGTAR